MNIIFCSWKSMMEDGVINGLRKLGFSVTIYDRKFKNYDTDTDYIDNLSNYLLSMQQKDAVFSVNYVPVIAMVCKVHHIPYISWTVDCPCLTLYSDTISYPTNYIFLFDKEQTERFQPSNPGHIFHLPLAFDPETALIQAPSDEEKKKYSHDISFIGTLYTEVNKYDSIADNLPKYYRGYVNGLISAQQNVYGYNLIQDSIDDAWAKTFMQYARFQVLPNYKTDYKSFVSDYFIGYKCSAIERTTILRELSRIADVHLYTTSDTSTYPEINNHGIADSASVALKIYATSKINLNITLRTITSGIPLRCFDIMGMGGFLLSNYQPELAEFFEDGHELVMYESISDLVSKVQYYLTHEYERNAIALAGQKKVHKLFSFEAQLQNMFLMIQQTSI